MKKMLYVGIDVSKHKLDVSLTVDGAEIKSHKTIKNSASGFKVLEEWVKKHRERLECESIHFCLESTGIYSEDVAEFLYNKKIYRITISNPSIIKSFSKTLNLRTKTDKVDSRLIACFAAKMKPKETAEKTVCEKKIQKLVRYMNLLIKKKGQAKGHLESIKDEFIRNSVKKIIINYEKQIKAVKKEIENFMKSNPNIKDKQELLKSIDGIGETTAQIILIELCDENNESSKFSKKCQTAHAGLSPRQVQSGVSIKGRSFICRTGNAFLRKSLYMPTLSAIRNNSVIKKFYEKLVKKGKAKKVAVIACMRKLLAICIGVLNNNKAFDDNWISTHPAKRAA